jgi:Uncharacterized protein conserved in bacteria (DUF2059)
MFFYKMRVFVLVFFSSFIWTGCMAIDQTSNVSATKLVKALKIEEIIVVGFKRPLLVGPQAVTKEDLKGQRYLSCVEAVDRTLMRARLAERVAEKFTSSELIEALEFYESEVGRKFVMRTLALVLEDMGISHSSNLPVDELDNVAKKRVEDFVSSSVGKKIVTERFFSSPENLLPGLQIMQKRVEWCQSQPL